jgi:hypothetical protein
MSRILKVLVASMGITICLVMLCFIFGPLIFGHEVIARNIGGNLLIISVVITLVAFPFVYRKLK